MTDRRQRPPTGRPGRDPGPDARIERLGRLEDHARARRQAIVLCAVAERLHRSRVRTPA